MLGIVCGKLRADSLWRIYLSWQTDLGDRNMVPNVIKLFPSQKHTQVLRRLIHSFSQMALRAQIP